MVRAAHRVWQATGDNLWLQGHLPVFERALDQLWRHPHRWSGELDLPKRPFTLDAWPVEYQEAGDRRQEAGDKSGSPIHHSCSSLIIRRCGACIPATRRSFMPPAARWPRCSKRRAGGGRSDATRWNERAEHIQAQINSVGWNGQFYTHQLHVSPVRVRGVDESRQLAAGNASAMNAGLASHEQCAAILKEYQRRRELQLETSFCEWWSVQPPFPEAAFGVARRRRAKRRLLAQCRRRAGAGGAVAGLRELRHRDAAPLL